MLPPRATYSPPTHSDTAMATLLQELRREHRQPAMAAAVVRSTGVIARAAVGSTVHEGQDDIVPAHRFHIGSVTKSLTTLLLARCVEDGRLSYGLTVREALPHVAVRPEYAMVTLHDLLTNRAGLIPYQQHAFEHPAHVEVLEHVIPSKTSDPRLQRQRVAEYALAQPPASLPGTKAVYSNVGWAVLGHVVETALDQAYELALVARVLVPLGMRQARVGGWPASSADPNQPRGHYVDGDRLRPQPLDDAYVLRAWMNPSGGVSCSVDDLAAYALEVVRGLGGEGLLLPARAYATIHSTQLTERASTLYQGVRTSARVSCGYGWGELDLQGARLSIADGSAGTFYARVAVLPAFDVAFAGLTNAGNGARALDAAAIRATGISWA